MPKPSVYDKSHGFLHRQRKRWSGPNSEYVDKWPGCDGDNNLDVHCPETKSDHTQWFVESEILIPSSFYFFHVKPLDLLSLKSDRADFWIAE